MAVALLVQLVILPFWFSVPHVGHDSLIGGDSMGYHTIALELLEKIEREGWGAWELRPHRQSPAGIAAVFYFFGALILGVWCRLTLQYMRLLLCCWHAS